MDGRKARWVGVDFSGDIRQWGKGVGRSNIWVAVAEDGADGTPRLVDLRRVQDLPGDEPPFARLAGFLAKGDFDAAAIDAPFSVPAAFIPGSDHAQLLVLTSTATKLRLFQEAEDFVHTLATSAGLTPPLTPQKPLRRTEKIWSKRGINVRSTMWAGSRGGAAMTAACLRLLGLLGGAPLWPWNANGMGWVVEAFPAAQLQHWSLPFESYDGDDTFAIQQRQVILNGLRQRIDVSNFEGDLLSCADAVDAAVCVFAGIAARRQKLAVPVEEIAKLEGWIAVHD